MATTDSNFRRISGGEIPPRGMAIERYNDYLAIFRDLGVENGLTWNLSPHPGGLFVVASSEVPIGGKGRSIGYVHSQVPLTPIVASLDVPDLPLEIHHRNGRRTVYRQLEDHWYLYYDSEW